MDAALIQGIFVIAPLQRVTEHGGFKQPGQILLDAGNILLHEALFAPAIVVGGDAAQNPDDHRVHVLGVILVEFGAIQPFQGQLLQGLHNGGGGFLRHPLQHGNAPVQLHLGGVRQQGRGEVVVDHVVRHPPLEVGENAVIQSAVHHPEMDQLLVALQGVLHADLVDQLVNVKKGEGERGFSNIPPAYPGAPGKISPQLLVRQGLVGGVVAGDLP